MVKLRYRPRAVGPQAHTPYYQPIHIPLCCVCRDHSSLATVEETLGQRGVDSSRSYSVFMAELGEARLSASQPTLTSCAAWLAFKREAAELETVLGLESNAPN